MSKSFRSSSPHETTSGDCLASCCDYQTTEQRQHVYTWTERLRQLQNEVSVTTRAIDQLRRSFQYGGSSSIAAHYAGQLMEEQGRLRRCSSAGERAAEAVGRV